MVKNLPANAGDIKDAGSFPGWKIPWRRAWQPTPVFSPGESHGLRSLVGYSPQGHKESDGTEATQHLATNQQVRQEERSHSTPGLPMHPQLPEFTPTQLQLMSTESVMPSNHLILCCPLLLPPSIFPSIRVFSINQFFTSGGQSTGDHMTQQIPHLDIQLEKNVI